MPTNKTLNKTNNNHNYYIDNDKDNNIRKTGDATASIIIILIIIWVIRGCAHYIGLSSKMSRTLPGYWTTFWMNPYWSLTVYSWRSCTRRTSSGVLGGEQVPAGCCYQETDDLQAHWKLWMTLYDRRWLFEDMSRSAVGAIVQLNAWRSEYVRLLPVWVIPLQVDPSKWQF